jgi:DNA-binding Lrp family transcriptional regulator|tara:strand:+ start:209 stop:904 length:696 start_codon:yes stop_codon:yes gene_type:complete
MKWPTAAEAGWSPIDHVFSTVRLSVDPSGSNLMKGRDIVVFKVKGKHRDSHIRLKFEEITEKKIVASFSVDNGNGKVTTKRVAINPSDGEDKSVTNEQFIEAYESTRTNRECGARLKRSASWVSRRSTKLRDQGYTLRRAAKPPDTMNIYGKQIATRRFIHAWNRGQDLDGVIEHLGLAGLRDKNRVKSRLSIMAGRFRDTYSLDMKSYQRGRKLKKIPQVKGKKFLPPVD